jgi:uncharacterized protein YegL
VSTDHTIVSDGFARVTCLPTYLVIDTSESMEPHTRLLNDTLNHIYDTVIESPSVSEFAHISLISFNTTAHLVLEMTDLEQVSALPVLTCSGRTSYGDAFDLVRERIQVDLPRLKGEGKAVLRPVMFFLTDGAPTDDRWETAFLSLTDRGWPAYPHVITFGFGNADPKVLSKVATTKAFLAEPDIEDEQALSAVLAGLLNSLVSSAATQSLQLPASLEGFIQIPKDYMD